ncbi:PEP-CTERM sorting domain-containing protein [Opitutaceae bacterium TAV4]|nr:PEP-CTERM sorting domain-containing protein [Opitutaceae bacterium TAV4]RRJ99044.1 PEP-CTERM sorting domain-containing protein [Opitutaceae bacterium TAV3]
MKTTISTHLSSLLLAAGILAAALSATSNIHASTYTLTTKSSDGGFDGWITVGNQSNSDGTQLRVGNAWSTFSDANRSASAILMFDLSKLDIDFTKEQIVSVTLSFYVTTINSANTITITHGVKATKTLVYGPNNEDTPTTLTNNRWTTVVGATSVTKTGLISPYDVTTTFLSDVAASNAYSSYRLAQADTYIAPGSGGKQGVASWGFIVASGDQTTNAVPTLTITTQSIPEPAHLGILLGGGILSLVLFIKRHR